MQGIYTPLLYYFSLIGHLSPTKDPLERGGCWGDAHPARPSDDAKVKYIGPSDDQGTRQTGARNDSGTYPGQRADRGVGDRYACRARTTMRLTATSTSDRTRRQGSYLRLATRLAAATARSPLLPFIRSGAASV